MSFMRTPRRWNHITEGLENVLYLEAGVLSSKLSWSKAGFRKINPEEKRSFLRKLLQQASIKGSGYKF